MVNVVDQLKYYQAIQMLYLWQTRTMERTRRAELRGLEGTESEMSELMRAAERVVRKIVSRIPTPIIDENANNKQTQ